MPEQHLYHPDIDAALQQMGREAMAHRAGGASLTRRMQRDTLVDPSFPRSFLEQPRQLPSREMFATISAFSAIQVSPVR
jgi:hypothetical protein